jgi:hypothetical protein
MQSAVQEEKCYHPLPKFYCRCVKKIKNSSQYLKKLANKPRNIKDYLTKAGNQGGFANT